MVFMDGTALNVVLPALQSAMGATTNDLVWIVNSYTLIVSALLLFGGSLTDRWGPKNALLWGVSLFSLGSLFCGFASSVEFLIAMRVLKGIGGSILIPASLTLLTLNFPAHEKTKVVAIWSAGGAVSTVIGPALGGFFAYFDWWRAIFIINLPIGLVCLFILKSKIESKRLTMPPPLDWGGSILITSGLASLSYGLSTQGYSPLFLFIGVILLLFFFLLERKVKHPLLPQAIIKHRIFRSANIYTVLVYGALNTILFFLPLNLIQVQGYSEIVAGLVVLPVALLVVASAKFVAKMVDKRGTRLPLLIGTILTSLSYLLLAFSGDVAKTSDFTLRIMPAISLLGLGMSFVVVPLTSTIMSSLPENYSGLASGVNNSASRLAGVLAIAFFGSLAVSSFSIKLQEGVEQAPLQAIQKGQILQQSARMADAKIPLSWPPEIRSQVQGLINKSFLWAFQKVGLGCTFLVLAGLLLIKSMAPRNYLSVSNIN